MISNLLFGQAKAGDTSYLDTFLLASKTLQTEQDKFYASCNEVNLYIDSINASISDFNQINQLAKEEFRNDEISLHKIDSLLRLNHQNAFDLSLKKFSLSTKLSEYLFPEYIAIKENNNLASDYHTLLFNSAESDTLSVNTSKRIIKTVESNIKTASNADAVFASVKDLDVEFQTIWDQIEVIYNHASQYSIHQDKSHLISLMSNVVDNFDKKLLRR